jgi:uncharacterized protein YoxC
MFEEFDDDKDAKSETVPNFDTYINNQRPMRSENVSSGLPGKTLPDFDLVSSPLAAQRPEAKPEAKPEGRPEAKPLARVRPESKQLEPASPGRPAAPTDASATAPLQTAREVLPVFTDLVLAQIGNAPRPADQLTATYLTAQNQADRQLAFEQLSELTDADSIARFIQINLIHNANKVHVLSQQLRAPLLGDQERVQKREELIAAIKELALSIFDGTPAPGTLPVAARPHSTDSVNDAIAQVLAKLRTDGSAAEVATALQQASEQRSRESRLVKESLTRFVGEDASADERAQAIAQIEQVNKSQPRRDLTGLLAELRAADAVLQLREAKTNEELSAKLNLLKGLSDGGNLQAAIVERYLTNNGRRDIAGDLAKGGEQADSAARTLSNLLTAEDGKAAEAIALMRVKEIFQNWPADGKPSATQLGDARRNLESLAQSETVKDWSAWVKTEQLLQRLSEPDQSERAFRELKEACRLGDRYARIAMSKILLSDSADLTTKWLALDSTRDALANKPGSLPDLSQLSGPQRTALKADALKEMDSLRQQENGLTRHDVAALGLALQASQADSSEAEQQFNSGIRSLLDATFNRGITADQRRTNNADAIKAARETEQALNGLFDAVGTINTNDTGARALMLEYAKATNSPDNVFLAGDRSRLNDIGRSFDEQVNAIIAKARTGNQQAILLLGFLAGSAGKGNSLNNNPELNEARSAMVPGNDRAKRAATALEEIAASRPDEVIAALSDRLQSAVPDNGLRLETLGKVMARTGRSTEQAREAIYLGLSSPLKETRQSAARGVLALAADLTAKDLDEIVQRPSAELTAELSKNVDRLTARVGGELTRKLVDSISDSTGDNFTERISQLAAMAGTLGRFISVADLVTLTKFAGESGLKLIQEKLNQDAEGSDDSAKEIQQLLGKTLLSIAESALDEGTRGRAITALASLDWGIAIPRDQQFKRRLEAFGVNHSDNPAVSDAVSRLTYGAQRPTLAAQFRELGLPVSDATLNRLTEQATSRYGTDKVQEVLNRIALFNSLPADVRLAVSGSGAQIEAGEKLNLKGKTLDSTTFGALPESVRKEINGNTPVRSGESITVDKDVNVVAVEFNRLSPEVRSRLNNGETRFLTQAQVASVGGPIDARTFNTLPAAVRRCLSGFDQPLKEAERLDLSGKTISAEDINSMPPALRAQITGSTAIWTREGAIPEEMLRGKKIDAEDFNRLSRNLRKKLSGKEDLLSEGERLPDLSRFSLDAARFNRLPADVRRTITGSAEELASNQNLDLKGKTFDAATFNALPEALRRRLNGGELPVLSGAQTFEPKPENATLDAAAFNALSPAARRLLTGTDRPLANGTVPLRGVELTAELFNKLPEDLRLALTGSTEPWREGRVARDLALLPIDAETFNALPETTRKALSSTDKAVDPLRVLTLLANGTLDAKDSPMKFLLQPPALEQQVAALRRRAATDSELSQASLNLLQVDIDGKLGGFYKNVNQSLGWRRIWDVAGEAVDVASLGTLAPSRTGLQVARTHAGDQWQYISQLRERQARLPEQLGQASLAALRADRMQLAQDVTRYFELAATGERLNADKLALSLYERYGEQLKTHAPSIYAELTAKGQGSLLSRMHANGFAQFTEIPRIPRAGSEQGTDHALALLRQLREGPRGQEFADTAAWRRQALVALDQAPSVRKLQETVHAVQEQMAVLQIEAKATGTRHEDLIEDAKQRVKTIKDLIGRFTADDLRNVRDLREDMRRALAASGDQRITDPKTREELDNRIKALTLMLQLVDKNEKLELGDQLAPMERRFDNIKRFLQNNHTLRGLVDQQTPKEDDIKVLDGFGPFPPSYSVSQKLAQLIQEYQSLGAQIGAAKKSGRDRLEELFEAVDKPSFSADTLQKWAATDGVILAATIVVSAAAIALTFGAATPLVAAALGALVGIGVAEGIKEIQYQAGLRDEGAIIGEYARGKEIEEIDGSKREMHAFWDVALPYMQELGMATATNYVGSELGSIIGGRLFRAFADRSGAVRQAIVAENRGALRVLAESIQQFEGMAVKPSLKEFGKAFVREFMSQSGFSIADQLSHGGVELVSRELGLDIDINNAIVGLAINICLGAMHRGVSLHMNMRSELAASRTAQRNSNPLASLNERHPAEIKYHAENATKEAQFIRDLELSGAKVSRTDRGFAVELNGTRIDFVRDQSPQLATAADASAADAHSASRERIPLDWIKDVDQAKQKGLRNLAEKLIEKGIAESQLLEYQQGRNTSRDASELMTTIRNGNKALEAFGRDPDAVRVLRDVRNMQALGQPELIEAIRLTREIAALKATKQEYEAQLLRGRRTMPEDDYIQVRLKLERTESELNAIKSAAKDEPSRQRLEQLIKGLSEKAGPLLDAQENLSRLNRPEGGSDFEVALANQRVHEEMNKLQQDAQFRNLKLEFAVLRDTLPPGEHFVTGPDGRRVKVRVAPGGSATMEQVNAVLARTVENGIRPNEIEFNVRHYARGSANFMGTVTIRGRGSDQHYLTTFDHESGHLHDFTIDSDSPSGKRITDSWHECLRKAGQALYEKAVALGDTVPDGGVDALVEDLSRTHQAGTSDRLKYYASRRELMAEMFAVYMHEQRLRAAGETVPSYQQLLTDVVGRDPHRAEVMRHFEQMYDTLRGGVFSDFATQRIAKNRFMTSQNTPEYIAAAAELRKAFVEQGGGSAEFRTAFEKLQQASRDQARQAVIDAIFARRHGLALDFNPRTLNGELASRYALYQRLTRDNYDPATDTTLSDTDRRVISGAHLRYKDSIAAIEALSTRRTDASLKDITRAHLNDFLTRHAPGLRQDIENRRLLGIDRVDPNGTLGQAFETARAHRLSSDEILADMYKVWLRKESLASRGQPAETFENLLKNTLGEDRAHELKSFPELWRKLNRDVFPAFKRMPLEASRERPLIPSQTVDRLGAGQASVRLEAGGQPVSFGRTTRNELPIYVSREALQISRTSDGYFMRTHPNATDTTSKTYYRIGNGEFVELKPEQGNVAIVPGMEIRLGKKTGPQLSVISSLL